MTLSTPLPEQGGFNEGLDEIEQVIRSVLTPNSYIVPQEGIELTKAILDLQNKRIEEVLDHLSTATNTYADGEIALFNNEEHIPLSAIEAERNKLKEEV